MSREQTWVVTIGTMQVLVRASGTVEAGQKACRRLRVTVPPDLPRARRAVPADLERWAEIREQMRQRGILQTSRD